MTKFLTPEQVISLNRDTTSQQGGAFGVRDYGYLESAVMTPQQSVFGQILHETLEKQTGAYIFHICQNHPFEDGNKRTALLSAETFLEMNKKELAISQEEKLKLILDVAEKKVNKEELTKSLEGKIKDIDVKKEQEIKEDKEKAIQEKKAQELKEKEHKQDEKQKVEKEQSEKKQEEKTPPQEEKKEAQRLYSSEELKVDRISDDKFRFTLASDRTFTAPRVDNEHESQFLKLIENSTFRQDFVKQLEESKAEQQVKILKVQQIEEPIKPPTPILEPKM